MKAISKKAVLFTLSIVLLSGLVFNGCASKPATEKPIEIKYAWVLGPNDPISQRYVTPMCKEIETRSGGRVKVTIYWSGALGAQAEYFDLTKNGLIDMCYFPSTYAPGKFPLCEVGILPFAIKDPANLQKAMTALVDKGYFDKEWGDVEVFGFVSTSTYHFLFKKTKPMTLAELAGLKVRSPGGYFSEYLKALGMVPVTIAAAEAYTSWERGLIDVYTHSLQGMLSTKLYDVPSKSLLLLGYGCYGSSALIFNKEKWASLPPDIQKIIRDVNIEYESEMLRVYTDADMPGLTTFAQAGVDIYSWPDSEMEKLKAAAVPIWEMYINNMESKGLPGKKIVADFVSILRELGEKPAYSPP